MKKILGFLITFQISIFTFSQSDSCHLRISLLTCSPGEELYSIFGHSALRVADSSRGFDVIYNYGTFDFDDPYFLLKFARGNMLYFVSIDHFDNFVSEYQYFKRGIIEQELNLSCAEKNHLALALMENAREENKYYKYDFLYDNCSTRLRDMVTRSCTNPVVFKKILPDHPVTFRNLIHEYLDKGQQSWSKLGIDILLGSNIDVPVKNEQAMFLPDYLMKGFDSADTGGRNLVRHKQPILAPDGIQPKPALITPFALFSLLFLLIAVGSFIPTVAASLLFSIFDFLLFFITGLLGILIAAMWLGREDTVGSNNYNILWALPTHGVMVWMLFKQQQWIKRYWLVSAIILILLIIFWKWLPQEMNNALLPFVLILLLRSFMRYKMIQA